MELPVCSMSFALGVPSNFYKGAGEKGRKEKRHVQESITVIEIA
jgi:hypothetical protein